MDELRVPYLSRRLVLAGLLASGAQAALAGAPSRSPRPQARPGAQAAARVEEALVARAGLGEAVSFALADMRTGEVLAVRKPLLRQPPASTAKVITTLYALDRLGADHRFETRLLATGPVSGGRIEGDLVLAGGGDPVLDTDGLSELAARLAGLGVVGLSGRFLVWPGALPRIERIDAAQPDHVGYNPALSGLNLNYNRVHFAWQREAAGYDVSLLARASHHAPQVRTAQMEVIDRRGPVYTYTASEGVDHWTVARGALGTNGSRWLPVRNPALYAGEVFAILARAQGISLPEAGVATACPEGRHWSRDREPSARRDPARHALLFQQPDGGDRGLVGQRRGRAAAADARRTRPDG